MDRNGALARALLDLGDYPARRTLYFGEHQRIAESLKTDSAPAYQVRFDLQALRHPDRILVWQAFMINARTIAEDEDRLTEAFDDALMAMQRRVKIEGGPQDGALIVLPFEPRIRVGRGPHHGGYRTRPNHVTLDHIHISRGALILERHPEGLWATVPKKARPYTQWQRKDQRHSFEPEGSLLTPGDQVHFTGTPIVLHILTPHALLGETTERPDLPARPTPKRPVATTIPPKSPVTTLHIGWNGGQATLNEGERRHFGRPAGGDPLPGVVPLTGVTHPDIQPLHFWIKLAEGVITLGTLYGAVAVDGASVADQAVVTLPCTLSLAGGALFVSLSPDSPRDQHPSACKDPCSWR